MSKQKKLILFAIALLLLIGINGGLYLLLKPASSTTEAPKEPEPSQEELEQLAKARDENYYRVRFAIGDAIELCAQEVRSRNSNLIQMHENQMATHFKEDDKIFLIQFETVVGTSREYDEKSHKCEIDPETQSITYYRETILRHVLLPGK
jgi:hypothetical protein